ASSAFSPDLLLALIAPPQLIEEVKQRHADDCVEHGENQFRLDIEDHRLIQQRALQNPVEKLVKQIEDEAQHQPHKRMLDVELHADRCREIADQSLADPVHADWLLKNGVLRQTERHANS